MFFFSFRNFQSLSSNLRRIFFFFFEVFSLNEQEEQFKERKISKWYMDNTVDSLRKYFQQMADNIARESFQFCEEISNPMMDSAHKKNRNNINFH